MSTQDKMSVVQVAHLRQFVEQVDRRLLLLMNAAKGEPDPKRDAEVARLERLRNLALGLLDQTEAAA